MKYTQVYCTQDTRKVCVNRVFRLTDNDFSTADPLANLPHTSYLTSRTSYLTVHTAYLTPQISYLTHHSSQFTPLLLFREQVMPLWWLVRQSGLTLNDGTLTRKKIAGHCSLTSPMHTSTSTANLLRCGRISLHPLIRTEGFDFGGFILFRNSVKKS